MLCCDWFSTIQSHSPLLQLKIDPVPQLGPPSLLAPSKRQRIFINIRGQYGIQNIYNTSVSWTTHSFEIFQDGSRPTEPKIASIANPQNPTLEPNIKWIWWPAEILPFEIFQMRGRSSIYILTLMSYTPLHYVRNVVSEEQKVFQH